MATPEEAFNLLVSVLSSRHKQVLEIEIIPSSLGSSFLKDGNSIGITKRALVQAFLHARQLFTKRLKPMSSNELFADIQQCGKHESEYIEIPSHIITEVILLFDCEHLTACNWRKNWLLAAISRRGESEKISSTFLEEMLETELTLLQSFQCSPLHRHTKSPTLWSHRLWVLGFLIQMRKSDISALKKLERAELDIVLRAGELHPKNYYAFTYMRNVHSTIVRAIQDQCGDGQMDCDMKDLIDSVLKWSLSSPRDISGWMFAIYLLDQREDFEISANAVKRVLRFALGVGWEGESLWTFVDQATRKFGLEDILDETFRLEFKQTETDSIELSSGKWPWRNRLSRARAYWASAAIESSDLT